LENLNKVNEQYDKRMIEVDEKITNEKNEKEGIMNKINDQLKLFEMIKKKT